MTNPNAHETDEPAGTKHHVIRLRHGIHTFEVRPVRSLVGVSYVGFYDGCVSVTASEPHIAVQMLLRRHIKRRRDGA